MGKPVIKYISKETIYQLYIIENKSISQITKILNISKNSVIRLIKKYQIQKADRSTFPTNRKLIEKEKIYNLYIIEDHTIEELCNILNICESTAVRYLERYDIKKDKKQIYKRISKALKNKTETEKIKIIEKRKQTYKKQTGYENPSYNPEIIEKIKLNWKNKTPEEIQEITEKRKKYCMKNYNLEYISQCTEVKGKVAKTNIERYGSTCYFSSEVGKKQIAQTNLEKYGTKNVFASEYGKQKIKETNLERYGVEYAINNEEVREKIKRTNLERYGVANPAQNSQIQEKMKQTNLERYGVENVMQNEKIREINYKSKLKNNSYNKSDDEDIIYDLLFSKNYNVKRQYRTELYPWNCDFYVVELDLYIEYQGFWTHGKKNTKIYGAYNIENPEHRQLLLEWTNKGYKDAIYTWTVSDPKKRETAKKNNLNWIEFFTMEEFMKWYENLPENK